jgi:hypothetical protein
MPDEAARSRLSATARVALPKRVRWRARATASSTTTEMMIDTTSRGAMEMGPHSSARWPK